MHHAFPRVAAILAVWAFASTLHAQQEKPTGSPEPLTQPQSTGITVARPAGVHISGPTTVCQGGETILKAEGDYESFEWNTGAKDRFLRVREEGTYEVTVITKGGCRLTSSVTVRMIPCS